MKFFDEIKLVFWILGRQYEQVLGATLASSTYTDLLKALTFAKKYFPFVNQGYFGGYNELKKAAEEKFKTRVMETSLPPTVLGTYVPSAGNKDNGTIIINKAIHPIFRLSTLAHEVSHVAVCHGTLDMKGKQHEAMRPRHRVSVFREALQDKEEVLADTLVAIGTYPLPDFQQQFLGDHGAKFPLKYFWRAFRHLRRHYPEVSKSFFFRSGWLLNLALILHFLRLRFFVWNQFGL